MYSEHGCYIEEGRLGTLWQKLTEMLRRDEYSGCFIPSFVLKVLYVIQDMKDRWRFEKRSKNENEAKSYEKEVDRILEERQKKEIERQNPSLF